jgi:hypothetical protein
MLTGYRYDARLLSNVHLKLAWFSPIHEIYYGAPADLTTAESRYALFQTPTHLPPFFGFIYGLRGANLVSGNAEFRDLQNGVG